MSTTVAPPEAARQAEPPAAPPPVGPVTADAFFRHAAAHQFDELVEGVIVPMSPAGGRHGGIAGNLYAALRAHVQPRGLGYALPDNIGYYLPIPGARRDTVRAPDASFVAAHRLPELPTGFIRLAPDLAAEVLSPDDRAADLQARMADYFAAGTRVLWVIDPALRTVAVHAHDRPTRWLGEADALDGGDVVPGFTMPVAELFAGLAPAAAAPPPPAA